VTADAWKKFLWWLRVAGLVVVLALLFWLGYYLRAVFNPLLIALAIAYALNPMVVSLSRKRMFGRPVGRTGAAITIFLAFVGVFAGIIAIATPVVGSEITHLTRAVGGERLWADAEIAKAKEDGTLYQRGTEWMSHGYVLRSADEPFEDLNVSGAWDPGEPFTDWDGDRRWSAALVYLDQNGNGRRDLGHARTLGATFTSWIDSVRESLSPEQQMQVSEFADEAARAAQARSGDLAATGFSLAGWMAAAVAGGARAVFLLGSILILIPLYTFFFMRGLDVFADQAIVYIPARVRPRAVAILTRIHIIMSAFIRGRAFIATVVSVMAWIGFLACGVPYALVLGLLCGLTIMVPLLPLVAAVLPAELLLLAEGAGAGYMLGVLAVYTLIQLIEGFYLSPRVLGEEGDMHPVAAIVAVFIGAELFGLFGAILAIPLAATAKILFVELLLPEMRELAGMGPGTETGKTQMIKLQVRGELIGGGLVKTELDEPAPDGAEKKP